MSGDVDELFIKSLLINPYRLIYHEESLSLSYVVKCIWFVDLLAVELNVNVEPVVGRKARAATGTRRPNVILSL